MTFAFSLVSKYCEVMPLHNFANFKLVMNRQRKELRGAPKSAEPKAMAYLAYA